MVVGVANAVALATPTPIDDLIVLAIEAYAVYVVTKEITNITNQEILTDSVRELESIQDGTLSPYLTITENQSRYIPVGLMIVEDPTLTASMILSVPDANVGTLNGSADLQCMPRYCMPAAPTLEELELNKHMFNLLVLQYLSANLKANVKVCKEGEQ